MIPSKIVIWVGSASTTMVAMELWAAFLHRRVWHRWLWPVHRTHHRGHGDTDARGAPPRGWQHNDALSFLHAPVAIALILYGCTGAVGPWRELAYGVGLGMSVFGVAYIVVHDGLAHGRLPVRRLLRWRYLRRVRAAHVMHHRTGGAPFGLFFGPTALRRRRAPAPTRP